MANRSPRGLTLRLSKAGPICIVKAKFFTGHPGNPKLKDRIRPQVRLDFKIPAQGFAPRVRSPGLSRLLTSCTGGSVPTFKFLPRGLSLGSVPTFRFLHRDPPSGFILTFKVLHRGPPSGFVPTFKFLHKGPPPGPSRILNSRTRGPPPESTRLLNSYTGVRSPGSS
ncbi:hypothetical protein CRG98_002955 [Punica granatum]|uniref:Uncharacterized protein n=1 Tax=Punica granatum TaxID=22663 RepID=A0A2I0L940_PUNGR|nr:hypothetical protein CRG98_002955 [Punica granatum]